MASGSVTIKSYRRERESEILNRLQKSLEKVGLIVERQARINVTSPMPSGKSHSYVDTNNLARSVKHEVGQGEVVIGTNIKYGKYLEFGHPDGSRHYPWLFPAVELKKPEIKEALKGHEFTIE